MELLQTLGRIAQNYGPGAAVAAAVAFLLFRFMFKRLFGKKEQELATREDVAKLLLQLEQTHREMASIKTQLARVDWLAQQQWLNGRSAHRAPKAAPESVTAPVARTAAHLTQGGPGS